MAKASDWDGNLWLTCVLLGARVRAGGSGWGQISHLSNSLRRARRKRRSTCPQGGNSHPGSPGLGERQEPHPLVCLTAGGNVGARS